MHHSIACYFVVSRGNSYSLKSYLFIGNEPNRALGTLSLGTYANEQARGDIIYDFRHNPWKEILDKVCKNEYESMEGTIPEWFLKFMRESQNIKEVKYITRFKRIQLE